MPTLLSTIGLASIARPTNLTSSVADWRSHFDRNNLSLRTDRNRFAGSAPFPFLPRARGKRHAECKPREQ